MLLKSFTIAIVTILTVLVGQPGFSEDRVPVFVSIVPQKYFVQQIGKDLVHVQVMVQPGASPATYEPKPKQMANLSKTKVYFAIGVPFEKAWLKKITAINPTMKVVHTDHGIEKIPMTTYHQQGEMDEQLETKEHRHERLDPHTWLSPPLAKIQAQAILTALQDIDPSHRNSYATNYQDFVSRISKLDSQLKTTFTGRQGLQFVVFHPAWGYFAHAYGLEQVPIEIEGKDPKPSQLKKLIEHTREKGIKIIFAQPQFSTKNAELVAKEIGGQVVFANPLAEDWMKNMIEVASKFKAALR